ncbi:MAG: hypothetical protein L7F77_06705 [Candidatus Magnetominusculus sp. LBB02]|nr:hypothetical protein [Candidatus Magnetominusculus sp. LBB02]
MKETNEGKRYYDHSLTEMEKPAAGRALHTGDTFSGSAPRMEQQARTISVKDLLKDVKTSDGGDMNYSIKKDEADKEPTKTKWQQLREKNKAIDAVSKGWTTRKDEIKRAFAPVTMGEAASKTGGIVRENAAEMVRKYDVAEAAMRDTRALFDKRDKQSNLDFIDNYETGKGQVDPKLQETASTIKELLDQRVKQVLDLGTGKLQNLIENYFPHLWKDPEKANKYYPFDILNTLADMGECVRSL